MAPTKSRQPNILIVVVDSLRADHVSCYGYHRETTPNIDRLAAEGCLFETAITAAPFSPASYASIFSNLYPHQHGVNGDTVRIWPDTWPRLAEQLREHGYNTFCVSNNSFVSRGTNSATGFDAFIETGRPTRYARYKARLFRQIRKRLGEQWALRWSSNRARCAAKGDSIASIRKTTELIDAADKPFFAFVILMDPHTPYDKRQRFYAGRDPAVRNFLRRRNGRTMFTELMAMKGTLSHPEQDIVRNLYDGEIRFADGCVGTLLDWLRKTERINQTVVAVTSDHGEAFGEHGVWGHGFCLTDALTRVPLVVRHPDYWAAGSRCPGLVQLHDLHELCLSVAATGSPRVDVHPHCLTQAGSPQWAGRDVVFSEFSRQSKTLAFMNQFNPSFDAGVWDHEMWAVRSAKWRCIEYGNGKRELYDLRADPGETKPLSDAPFEVLQEFQARLEDHRNDQPYRYDPEEGTQETDELVLERLRALGYIE